MFGNANLMGLPAASASDPLILPLEFERGAFLLTFQAAARTAWMWQWQAVRIAGYTSVPF